MKFLAKFSVENSLIVNVFSFFFIIAGIASLMKLNREAFPNINFDKVTINTAYPGSTPQEVEKLITIPIETELKQVDDIEQITSVSAEGISVITITIEEDADNKDRVVNEIQRAVDRVEDLPSDLPDRPLVTEIKTKDRPVLDIAVSGKMSEFELRKHALALEKKFLDLKDTSKVSRVGYRDHEIWVTIDPKKIQNHHISLQEVITALDNQNKSIPGGKFYDKNKEFILRTSGEFETAKDVSKTIVRASTFGNSIQLSEIANVKDAFEEEDIINKTFGTRSISLTVIKKEKGDAIRLADQVKELIKDYKKIAPENLRIDVLNDWSFFIRRRLNILINNGIIGLTMVMISLFFFLSSGTALGACIGIPTALMLTFSLMGITDISINLISLFGLIMVLGMLVDEDIVISENIHRHFEEGETSEEAAIKGAQEVAKPVVATVLTTIAAFIPIYFMGGILGKFIQNIPTVIILTLSASLLEALIILPSHVFELNKKMKAAKLRNNNQKHFFLFVPLIILKQKFNKGFNKTLKLYEKSLHKVLKYRYLLVVGLIFSVIGTLFIFKNFMHYRQFPNPDIERVYIRTEGNIGDPLELTEKNIRSIEKIVAKLPKEELESYTTQIGILQKRQGDPFTNRAPHMAQVHLKLTPKESRTRDYNTIIADLRKQVKDLHLFKKVTFEKFAHGPPSGKPVDIRVVGDNFNILQKISKLVQKKLETYEGLTDIENDYELGKNEKHIVVNPIKAAQADLSVYSIATSVRQAFEGYAATKIRTSEEEIDIVVRYPLQYRSNHKVLEDLLIPNGKGNLIPLSSVAHLENRKGVHAIKHLDGTRSISVTANLDETITSPLAVVEQIKPFLKGIEKKYPTYKFKFEGEYKETQESKENLIIAFGLSALLILIILISIFQSLTKPFIVMLTIPLSIIGVIIAFFLHGKDLSFMAILGFVGLTGIAVDNAIIMIDFINKYLKEGREFKDAVISGSVIRFRPVVLTSVTTILGVVPASYGIGGKDPFIEPMALALNYGIFFSTILTLFYLPVFLAIWEDIKIFFSKASSLKNLISNQK